MGLRKRLEDMALAITFAEVGEFDEARRIMCEEQYIQDKFLEGRTDQRRRVKEERTSVNQPLGRR